LACHCPGDINCPCDVCGLIIYRDYNASRNIRRVELIKAEPVKPELTTVEIATSAMHGIYSYRQMSVVESGTPHASVCGSSLIFKYRLVILYNV
jgi:hypothetical protein